MRNRARPKSRRHHRTHQTSSSEINENRMDRLIRDLSDFEDFRQTILPAIRRDIQAGLTAKELREKYMAIVQARIITEAVTNEDAGKAVAAAKDIIDRAEGKPTERKEVTHKFEDMSDEELEAILKSEEAELEDMAKRFDH